MKAIIAALFCSLLASIAIASPTSPFKNLDVIAFNTNIDSYANAVSKRTVKIAILDNGFAGHESLPFTYHAGPIAVDAKTEESHGTYMAQIVSGLLDRTPGIQYDLHLFSAFGYSNLAAAVKAVVDGGFDVVLYSQVWEYGGNGDGRGFINTLVNQATSAGVVWINASGNFGNATYTAPVEVLPDQWAYLPSPNHGVRVRCYDNKTKKCSLRAVLSWNDFKDQPEIGTDKDLDLVLSDDTLKVLRTGGLQQVVTAPANGTPGTSLYPREIVEADLTPGIYELRVKVRSANISKDTDRLRIVTSGDYLEQLDITDRRETLLAPADNASVITVGASDSDHSSSSASMGKPEISVPSEILLNGGDSFKGSSNSAAMTAALAVIARGLNPSASRQDVLDFLAQTKGRVRGPSTPTAPAPTSNTTYEELGFAPTGPGCFRPSNLPDMPGAMNEITKTGVEAVMVETNAGYKIMLDADPFSLGLGVQRQDSNDMLVVNQKGFLVFGRSVQLLLQPGTYEVLQRPRDAVICGR